MRKANAMISSGTANAMILFYFLIEIKNIFQFE